VLINLNVTPSTISEIVLLERVNEVPLTVTVASPDVVDCVEDPPTGFVKPVNDTAFVVPVFVP